MTRLAEQPKATKFTIFWAEVNDALATIGDRGATYGEVNPWFGTGSTPAEAADAIKQRRIANR